MVKVNDILLDEGAAAKKSSSANEVINRYVNWVSKTMGISKEEAKEEFIYSNEYGKKWLSIRPISKDKMIELFPGRSKEEKFNIDAFEKEVFHGTGWSITSYLEAPQIIFISPYISIPKPKYLYHGTVKDRMPNIMKKGLKPGTSQGLFRYNNKLFLFTEYDKHAMMNLLTVIHGSQNKKNIVILRINTEKFNKFNIYKDINADDFDAVFTLSHIPPKALEVIK